MANLKSSKKDLRRTAKRRESNLATRTSLKTFIKKARTAEAKAAPDKVSEAMSKIDKAVQNGVIHKNQAARRKSRLAKAIAKP